MFSNIPVLPGLMATCRPLLAPAEFPWSLRGRQCRSVARMLLPHSEEARREPQIYDYWWIIAIRSYELWQNKIILSSPELSHPKTEVLAGLVARTLRSRVSTWGVATLL